MTKKGNSVVMPLHVREKLIRCKPTSRDNENAFSVKEVIIATNPTLEGDATSLYLAKLLKPLGIKIMRIAHGLPIGSELEFADTATITKSLTGRIEI